jgi:membrane-associated PAP2 superfamily phosphatase
LQWPGICREAANGIVAALATPAAVALGAKLIWPASRLVIPARAMLLMTSTLLLGPGLLTNAVLKEHWGRPRPVDVREFGGALAFVPWWDPGGECAHNCSFVAGEGSGAFWTLAPAAVVPAPVKVIAFAAAVSFGAAAGMLRVAFGAHFFTDVVFSGVLTFAIVWIVHGILYRWSVPSMSDAALEARIEELAAALRRAAGVCSRRLGILMHRLPGRRSA